MEFIHLLLQSRISSINFRHHIYILSEKISNHQSASGEIRAKLIPLNISCREYSF